MLQIISVWTVQLILKGEIISEDLNREKVLKAVSSLLFFSISSSWKDRPSQTWNLIPLLQNFLMNGVILYSFSVFLTVLKNQNTYESVLHLITKGIWKIQTNTWILFSVKLIKYHAHTFLFWLAYLGPDLSSICTYFFHQEMTPAFLFSSPLSVL